MTERAWSYSKLKNAETCLKRYYHYDVAKDVIEPESDELRRGKELHKHFENRLLHGTPLPLGYGQHEAMLARIVAAPGQIYGEQKLAITSAFEPSAYFGKGAWCRTQIDVAKVNGQRATVFDWKTGKPSDDVTQLQVMAAVLMAHMPALERVRSALVFVNYEQTERAEYTRDSITEIWSEILPRVRWVQKAHATQEFPPKPSGLCKKYCAVVSCPYHGKGG